MKSAAINRIAIRWNDSLVLEGHASAVMALQLCEGMAAEFAGDTARDARHELFCADLLSHAGNTLPATRFAWSDETGRALILINIVD